MVDIRRNFSLIQDQVEGHDRPTNVTPWTREKKRWNGGFWGKEMFNVALKICDKHGLL